MRGPMPPRTDVPGAQHPGEQRQDGPTLYGETGSLEQPSQAARAAECVVMKKAAAPDDDRGGRPHHRFGDLHVRALERWQSVVAQDMTWPLGGDDDLGAVHAGGHPARDRAEVEFVTDVAGAVITGEHDSAALP